MKITTNLKTGDHGAGLCEGDILDIQTDEECVYIASEVMTEYRLILHYFRGAPITIDQEDYTSVAKIRLEHYGITLAGKKVLVKIVCYGVDNQQDEFDEIIYIYPRGTNLTDPNAPAPPAPPATAQLTTMQGNNAAQPFNPNSALSSPQMIITV